MKNKGEKEEEEGGGGGTKEENEWRRVRWPSGHYGWQWGGAGVCNVFHELYSSDIAYDVSRLSRYTHNLSSEHWNALHRLLRYLRDIMDWCLYFNKFPAILEGFCDANWVTDNDEVSFTSGYVFTLGAGAILWKSSKKTCIACSTMDVGRERS
ncbi:hypothetical protein FXO37_23714 [Capsicum annuum]|nr:hypothetical protein FXO37_23714 [Capsicum annuum]